MALALPGLCTVCTMIETDGVRVDGIATDSTGTVHMLKQAGVHHTWDQDTAAAVRIYCSQK